MPSQAVAEAPNEKIRTYLAARERLSRASTKKLTLYLHDPIAFVHDCVDFGEGGGLTPYQEEVIAELPIRKRVAQRAGHGAGKSLTAALLIHWFSLTRDACGIDWKTPITASAWRQLERYLMPEVHKTAKLLRWDKIGRTPYGRSELLRLNLNLAFGSAFAVASDTPAYIEGAHADSLLYILDEAKAIPDATFDAVEGAFSGAGSGGREAFALTSSTPGEPIGRFYDIHTHKKGYEDWWTRHVTLEEAVAAGRINEDWAEQRATQWGRESAVYANRVLGEFHSADEDGVIPLSWVEAAVERYLAREDLSEEAIGPLTALGVDVARQGEDRSAFARRHGNRVTEVEAHHYADTMETTGLIVGILRGNPGAIAIIDTDGLGAGVTDRTREQGYAAAAFHAGTSAPSYLTDRSGELGFANCKAAAWWRLREALDPAYDPVLELPSDDDLIGDLTAPKWKVLSNGRIAVEKKDDVKKRLGRSTDKGDAVVHAFWDEPDDTAFMGSMGAEDEEDEEDEWSDVA